MKHKFLKHSWIRLLPEERLYHCPVPIIAVTGGISSGKSTVLNRLKTAGYPALSADELIKEVYQLPKIIAEIKRLFPYSVSSSMEIDFPKIRESVFSNENNLRLLESILYPELPALFLHKLQTSYPGAQYIFYEIPLLFEKNLQSKVDVILVVSSSPENQSLRTQKRDGSSIETIKKIINQQGEMDKKIRSAHIHLENNGDLKDLDENLRTALLELFNNGSGND